MNLQRLLYVDATWLSCLTACLTSGTTEAHAASLPSDSALTASSSFLRLPVDVLDILPESTRFDMLVYFENDSIYRAPNALEGTSYLKTVTPDFLEVQITEVSSLQLKLLPYKKGETLIMTLYTVGGEGQADDTDIRFFTSDMRELPRERLFPQPELKVFFSIPKGSLTSMKEIEQTIPFPTVRYSASSDGNDITGKLTVESYMNQDDYNVIRLFEKPSVCFIWNGNRYRPDKK